jgi:hypothetical protein
LAIKSQSVQVAAIKTFNGFAASVLSSIDVAAVDTVVIWRKACSQFISAGKYK